MRNESPAQGKPLLTPFGVLLVNKLRVRCCELHAASPSPPFTQDPAHFSPGVA